MAYRHSARITGLDRYSTLRCAEVTPLCATLYRVLSLKFLKMHHDVSVKNSYLRSHVQEGYSAFRLCVNTPRLLRRIPILAGRSSRVDVRRLPRGDVPADHVWKNKLYLLEPQLLQCGIPFLVDALNGCGADRLRRDRGNGYYSALWH